MRGIRFYDGLIVASVSTDDIFVLDPTTGKTVSRFKGRLILLARNGENPAALIASGDTIRIYDMRPMALWFRRSNLRNLPRRGSTTT